MREDALQMLDVLAERHWQQEQRSSTTTGLPQTDVRGGGGGCDTVIGSLPESWLQHQLRLSTKLARCAGSPGPPLVPSWRQGAGVQHVFVYRHVWELSSSACSLQLLLLMKSALALKSSN